MQTIISSFEEIALEIDRLLSKGKDRTILGIVGKPGAGKSTITSKIMEYLGGKSVALFPMDGYHLSNQVLVDLGRRERKGAPDTFDASAFTSLLGRIKYETDKDIYFPIFHRDKKDISQPFERSLGFLLFGMITEQLLRLLLVMSVL